MSALLAFSRIVDRFNIAVGSLASWTVLAAVLVSAGNAVTRKTLNVSSNAWLELQWYLFGAAFMLTAAWTLRRGEHVRVEVIFAKLSQRSRDWIDLLGYVLFLLPFVAIMIWYLIGYVAKSYYAGEHSSSVGGLIIWPAKALLLAGFVLLALQALSEIAKKITALTTGHHNDDPPVSWQERAEAEAKTIAEQVQK